MSGEVNLASVFQDRTFTAGNVGKIQNVRGDQLAVESYYFKPGQGLAYHQHPESEQIYIIFEGEGTFFLDTPASGPASIEVQGETSLKVKPGSVVLAPAGIWHRLDNNGGGGMIAAEISHLPTTTMQRDMSRAEWH